MAASLKFKCVHCGHTVTLFVRPSANPTHQCKPTIKKVYEMKPA